MSWEKAKNVTMLMPCGSAVTGERVLRSRGDRCRRRRRSDGTLLAARHEREDLELQVLWEKGDELLIVH